MKESIRRQLKQAWVIISSAWQRNLNYRFTVLTYRLGEVAENLVLILMWSAIYSSGSGTIKGFTLNEMISYVLIGNLCSVAVRNFLPMYIARDISEGRLSMFLVRPISYIKYIFLNEVGRAALVIFVSLISQIILILFFLNRFYINTDVRYLLLIVIMVFFAFTIELLIGFLVGAIAFWTDEVDGIEGSIGRVKRFFSGGYFPLNLLPTSLATASMYLPFQYSFFAPAQLYLKKIDLYHGIQGLTIQVGWIVLLSIIISLVWKKGLRKYEAVGS